MEAERPIPCLVGERSAYPDPFVRGLGYLQQVQQLTPVPNLIDPKLINCMEHQRQQIALCTWIGLHIDTVNAELNACLQSCQACFHDWERRSVQVFAAPFCPTYSLDGLCNLQTIPPTLLIDVGRVLPQDWLGLVAHEYAHAHVGIPGHEQLFFNALAHLCLGLGLPSPQQQPADRLPGWPPSRRVSQPIDFWLGHHWPCALPVTTLTPT